MPQSAIDTHGASRDALLDAFWTKIPNTAVRARRGCPRVHANVPVRVSGTGIAPLKTRTNDLSLGGLQLRCDRKAANCLRPDPTAVTDGNEPATPRAVITLLLTIDGQTMRVSAHGEVVHLTLLPNSDGAREVAVGFKFVDFEEGSREVLMRFIEYHLHPAGV